MNQKSIKIIAVVAIVLVVAVCAAALVVTQPATHEITADAEDGGSISPSGKVSVKDGESVTFTATADEGYAFAGFYVNGISVSAPSGTYTFENVTSNGTITARFVALSQYTVTATATEGGSISPSESTVYAGASLTFTASPAAGYIVSYYTVDGEIRQNGGNTFVLSNIHADCAVTVVFVKAAEVVTIAASATEGGTISPSGDVSVPVGGSQSFTAYPAEGYAFLHFVVDGVIVASGDNMYTFSGVTTNRTIRAVFELVPVTDYIISASATEGGTISPSGDVSVAASGSQTFTVAPAEGYAFLHFEIDGEIVAGTGYGYTFGDVSANRTIRAVFEALVAPYHTITASATEGGSITPSGAVGVNDGKSVTFVFAADGSHVVGSVLVDGTPVDATSGMYTFENVTSDRTIEVVFAEKPATSVVSISVTPEQIRGHIGEPLDLSEITVTATYLDGTTGVVTGWTISPMSWDTLGLKSAVVTYGDVTAEVQVLVTYKAFGITATATEGGKIVPGNTAVYKGGSQSFMAVADPGFLFSHFVVDGEIVLGSDVVYTFENVTSAHTIEAVFVVGPPALVSIAIEKMPDTTVYFEGDMFDSTGMVVIGTYSDGSVKEVYKYAASPMFLSLADTVVTISYGGATAEVPVTVKEVVPESIVVTTPPTKIGYFVGEEIDVSGMVVTVKYNNGSTSAVTEGYTYSPDKFDTTGSHDVTVSYLGLTTTFEVKVFDSSHTSVVIKNIDGVLPEDPTFNGSGLFNFDLMVPGTTHTIVLTIKNDTSMNLDAMVFVRGIEPSSNPLLPYMTIQFSTDEAPGSPMNLRDVISESDYDLSGRISLDGGCSCDVTIILTFLSTASGSDLMGKDLKFTLGVGKYQTSTS